MGIVERKQVSDMTNEQIRNRIKRMNERIETMSVEERDLYEKLKKEAKRREIDI